MAWCSARASLLVTALLSGCTAGSEGPVAHPRALAHTHPIPLNQVQDVAFWTHPTDPGKSLILATNETKGLEVHDVDGYVLKLLPNAAAPQYVDVIYGLAGKDYALVSCKDGIRAFAIDPDKRKLTDATAEGKPIATFGGNAPLGLFCYHSRKTDAHYAIVTDGVDHVEQYALAVRDDEVVGTLARKFDLPGHSKGGCADDDLGVMYLSEDKTGVWRFPAEPDEAPVGTQLLKPGDHGLAGHARGPVIYKTREGGGYLVLLGQGAKGGEPTIGIYERGGANRFLASVEPSAELYGALDHSSGLDVTSAPFGKLFPKGALAVNDQDNPNGSEDFKLYSWAEIARACGLSDDGAGVPRGASAGGFGSSATRPAPAP